MKTNKEHIIAGILMATVITAVSNIDSLIRADHIAVSVVREIVVQYCKVPESMRLAYRERWKEQLVPNSISISCGE